ncbi:MAG: 50S ribosomal protein L5 [Candidatus Babeliaceae bacterium]|jgi:large subunit ribosomal protein L5
MNKTDKARMAKPYLENLYTSKFKPALKEHLKLSNIMEVPKLSKIVLNVGVKEAVADSKALAQVIKVLTDISGQVAVKTAARKSIAGFKIREGMNIGAMVTLRGKKMYEFLYKLINLGLPKVRDFQGTPVKLDGRGNYNLGIKEWNIFPEAESTGVAEKSYGLNITFHTTALNDVHGFELLKTFGMPFRKGK